MPADVVGTVLVLHALEGCSDRDAVDQLRTNIAWKVAAGRSLTAEGFHSTVLTLWRNKLRASAAPQAGVRRGAGGDRPDRGVAGQDPPGARTPPTATCSAVS
jgi:hypothetical protein